MVINNPPCKYIAILNSQWECMGPSTTARNKRPNNLNPKCGENDTLAISKSDDVGRGSSQIDSKDGSRFLLVDDKSR